MDFGNGAAAEFGVPAQQVSASGPSGPSIFSGAEQWERWKALRDMSTPAALPRNPARLKAYCMISMVSTQSASPSHAAGIPRPFSREKPRQGNPRGSQAMHVPTHNACTRFSAIKRSRASAARAALNHVLALRFHHLLGPVDPAAGLGFGGCGVHGGQNFVVAAVGNGHEFDPETLLDLLRRERLGRSLEGRRNEHPALPEQRDHAATATPPAPGPRSRSC